MIGGPGNDTLRWLPGTLIDVFEGGTGHDTAIIVGNDNNQGDDFVLYRRRCPGTGSVSADKFDSVLH